MMIDRKQRLFEMMNRVAGMPLNEEITTTHSDLPPGFSDADFESIGDFAHEGLNEEMGSTTQKVDVKNMVGNKLSNISNRQKQYREEPYIHNKTITKIVDTNNNEINLDELKRIITERPDTIISTNTKVGKNNILKISLPSYKGLFYNERTSEFEIVNTCPNAGECKVYCFANQGGNVMWENSSLSKTRILNFLLNHWEAFKYKVIDEIERVKKVNNKNGLNTIIRWHDSGDFLSEKYLALAIDIARQTPDVLHYAYTKMVSSIKSADVPDNFVFSFSVDQKAPENHMIDTTVDKHATVVPFKVFDDLAHAERKDPNDKKSDVIWVYNTPTAFNDLRQRMADMYDIDVNSIISFNQLMKTQQGSEPNKWNVIVSKTDGDMAATRKDVLGTYLLQH